MRLLLTVLIALFFAGSALAETITIATFNAEFLTRPKVHIKFGLPFKMSNASQAQKATWNQPGFRDQKFGEAANAVAEVVHSLNADVVALTEVGDESDVNELNQAISTLGTDYLHVAVCECTDGTTKQRVAVLSKFPFTDIRPSLTGREGYYEELDDAESEKDTGISKGLRVSFQAHGQAIDLYVIHLASERGGHEQDQQRVAQASIVRRHTMARLINDADGEHVIVAGDLNDHPAQPALRRIRGMDDIWPDLIQTGAARYFDDDKLGTRWTYEFMGKRNQIDHILLSQSVKRATKKSKGIQTLVVDHGNELASDHRALVVKLNLR